MKQTKIDTDPEGDGGGPSVVGVPTRARPVRAVRNPPPSNALGDGRLPARHNVRNQLVRCKKGEEM